MNSKALTLGSLFDGSGGFPLGGILSGITPLWASEIEPFPIRVTTKRLSQMKHYGDVSKLNGAELPPVDIITFGSPCQDMSVAGKRAGLSGSRSNLFYEAVRIVKEMRCKTNGEYPRFVVWENVPGAFSSNKGEDFKAVLEEICKIKDDTLSVSKSEKWTNAGEIVGDAFSVAWRVFDAQYWGVPQRRKRIYLVADFAGECAGEILFEQKSLSGNSPQSVCKRKTTPGNVKDCIGATGFDGYNGQLTGDLSATIGVNCGMSTGRNGIVLNDQGGNRMDITEDVTCTLRAEAHHPPCVLESAGFCTEHSAKSRGIGYEEETSPTIRAGTVPAAVMFENHSQDTRYTGPVEKAPTVLSTYGTGGNNQPFVIETPKTLKIRSGCDGGGKGALVQDNKSATLSCNNDQTVFVPQAYGICSKDSNSMKSDNPNSGFYKAETSRTIDTSNQSPCKNQGGIAVVSIQGSMIGRKDENGPQGDGINEDVSFTLNATDKHAVAYGIDRAAFNQGQNAKYSFAVETEKQPTMVAKGPGAVATPTYSSSKASFFTKVQEEKANTLVATDYKDPPIVNDNSSYGFYPQMKAECVTFTKEKSGCIVNGTNPGFQNGVLESSYIVRRLTPTECARLQGFPDWWCSNLETENPTSEELAFWRGVFKTYAEINGTKVKYDKQIIKWLKNPHSDSAEYKMWGNGVALPCVCFVLSRIASLNKTISTD
ncbi:DNA (cytosine-5-)-methyltransferase [Ruminococcus sp. AM28-29LB]|nr:MULTISPECIES: DNA (cytosine-5-)-methyltransferase [Ruminococcus]RGH88299.1 DNA (cytosine-5-)-methyltransferase [Ruminococcus sp. AM28-29LB]UWG11640.1 MAG: C-5 cytosine-specific DNA methylase [Bacteriophage sp.]DAZ34726.1 MAG TPA: Cytosine specific methyltransferase [Caudoviricetes sp.]